MRRLIVLSFISLDGVMQAPGGPEEDPARGFKHGGWVFGYFDDFLLKVSLHNNGEDYYAELDENDKPINAGNQFPKDEYNKMLDDLEMEADYNTVNFTFFDGKFIERQRPQRL